MIGPETTLAAYMSSDGKYFEGYLSDLIDLLNLNKDKNTVGELLRCSDSSLDIVRKGLFKAVKLELSAILYPQPTEPFHIENITSWLIKCGHDTGDNFQNSIFYSDLCVYEPSCALNGSTMLIDDIQQRAFHTVLVVSGESGAGKSFSAVHLFPNLLLQEKTYQKLLVFYCCRNPQIPDLDGDKQKRDDAAEAQLEEWWNTGWSNLCDMHPGLKKEQCEEAAVVMVVDELGNRPQLLRGLISRATAFERKHTTGINETSDSNSDLVKVCQYRLVCVGTGLDWSVHHLDWTVASDCGQFYHIQLQQWPSHKLRQYAEQRLRDKPKYKEVINQLMTLQLSRLGSNPRCAQYLVDVLIKDGRIFSSLSPGPTLYYLRGEIFRAVASRYRSANGIAKLFLNHKNAASRLLSSALRLAYAEKVSDIAAIDLEDAQQLLIYGVLHYKVGAEADEKLFLSPAMLLMLLSEFGHRDTTVLDGEGFEQLVALRELGHILMKDAAAKVVIIALKNPIPSTVANASKMSNKCCFVLPSDFFDPSTQGSSSIKRVYDDSYYIIVNGPKAPSVDIFVLPPARVSGAGKEEMKARFIQAKKYRNGYKPSCAELDKELANFGLRPVLQRATYLVHQALADERSRQHVFVLSSDSGDSLKSKIAKMEGLSQVDLSVEVVHPIWQDLVLDGDLPNEHHKYTVEVKDGSLFVTSARINRRSDDGDEVKEANGKIHTAVQGIQHEVSAVDIAPPENKQEQEEDSDDASAVRSVEKL